MKAFCILINLVLGFIISGCVTHYPTMIQYDEFGKEFRCEGRINGGNYNTSILIENKNFINIKSKTEFFTVSPNGKYIGIIEDIKTGRKYQGKIFDADNGNSIYNFPITCGEDTEAGEVSVEALYLAISNNGRIAVMYRCLSLKNRCILKIHDLNKGLIKERTLLPLSKQPKIGTWRCSPTSLAISANGKTIVWAAGYSYYGLLGDRPKINNENNSVFYVWDIQQTKPSVIQTDKASLIYDVCLDKEGDKMAYWYWGSDRDGEKTTEVIVMKLPDGKILKHHNTLRRVKYLSYNDEKKEFIVNK